ncbi:hypothetical protein E4U16_004558 [Claviceps sp. LM84 group G4]|nr:hypothetical protein E4U16_004558 [Claviceps sp. LM84 group G4]
MPSKTNVEDFNEDSLAEDPLSEEEQSVHSPEESSDPSPNSSADNIFDDSHADALDEDISTLPLNAQARESSLKYSKTSRRS